MQPLIIVARGVFSQADYFFAFMRKGDAFDLGATQSIPMNIGARRLFSSETNADAGRILTG